MVNFTKDELIKIIKDRIISKPSVDTINIKEGPEKNQIIIEYTYDPDYIVKIDTELLS